MNLYKKSKMLCGLVHVARLDVEELEITEN